MRVSLISPAKILFHMGVHFLLKAFQPCKIDFQIALKKRKKKKSNVINKKIPSEELIRKLCFNKMANRNQPNEVF